MIFVTCYPAFANGQQLVFSLYSADRQAKATTGVVAVDDVALQLYEDNALGLQMQVTLMGALLPKRERVVITPRLVAAADSVDFPAVELFGRWAYYHFVRDGVSDDSEVLHFRDRDARTPHAYAKSIDFQPWMRDAQLKFIVTRCNGCDDVLLYLSHFASPKGWPLTFVQQQTTRQEIVADTVQVVTEGVTRHFQGAAFIDFVVNRTDVDPNYRSNRSRLEEIRATIDSVLNRDRSRLQHITLKGFASPEGAYTTNETLASGRVSSLRRYFIDNFDVPANLITVEYEAEDWQGLRRYVAASDLPERQALLDIIDSDLHPDVKLARITERYPGTYYFLLTNVFPTLRHTDYRIDYAVREKDQVSSRITEKNVSMVETLTDAPWQLADSTLIKPAPATTYSNFRTFRPFFALKTNLLFDAVLAPNIEVEVPLGRKSRWSLMAEVWCPWWRFDHNPAGEANPYYRSDQRPTKTAYELLTIGAELRYWIAPRCAKARPALTGAFLGLYGAGGKYDLGYKGEGDQGEFTSLGLSGGYSWPLARHWNLELSAAVGYVGGPKVHYVNEFDDARLIYRRHNTWHYFGPTKLKLSLAWVIGK